MRYLFATHALFLTVRRDDGLYHEYAIYRAENGCSHRVLRREEGAGRGVECVIQSGVSLGAVLSVLRNYTRDVPVRAIDVYLRYKLRLRRIETWSGWLWDTTLTCVSYAYSLFKFASIFLKIVVVE